ncbi:helix-turn-helix transcriptional regulator [Eisenbergiella sp.]
MSNLFPGMDFGNGIAEIAENENCIVLKVENETGEGVMTCYKLFPGVVVMYNDYHMSYCVTEFQTTGSELLCIDHCREGAIERLLHPDVYYYFSAGDVTVDMRKHHAGRTNFPQSHFHGISIGFYLPEANRQLAKELSGFPVSLRRLQQKFCTQGTPFVLPNGENIARIFDILYRLPRENPREFLRLKVFELLLYLDGLPAGGGDSKAYFYKSQVEKVKAAQKLMTENLTERYTVEELAKRFDLSQSALKSCFKEVFGLPIHTYLQEYRIRRAAALLQTQRNLSVAQAAGQVGYDSPGKFAAVFKRIYGVSPREYRNGGLL